MLCLATAGAITALVATSFTLAWTHSVEHTRWEESWRVAGDRLALGSATVKGPGAGIGLPEEATWIGDKWQYEPAIPPLQELNLAASGATGSGWTLCTPDQCLTVGDRPGDGVRLWAEPEGVTAASQACLSGEPATDR